MDVETLTSSINTAATTSQNDMSEAQRQDLLAACKKLQSTLETPREKTMDILTTPYIAIGLRLGVDMLLFDREGESTVEELAAQTGAESLLVKRTLRLLTAASFFAESSSDPVTYKPTPLARNYASSSPFAAAIIHSKKVTSQMVPLTALPTYLSENAFKCPEDAYNGAFQYARGTPLHAFDWLATQPKLQAAFNTVMTMSRPQPFYTSTSFPVLSKLPVSDPSSICIVDIGGGVGHVLRGLKAAFPQLRGKMIVQDLPSVISSIEPGSLPDGISAMGCDFFAAQPIHGARAYYLRAVLHDWPDAQALDILGHVTAAMDRDSLVLVNEGVMPERGGGGWGRR
ncbi:O-methyltransferase lepI, partial [Lachnellula suecica]